ncbi:MAG: Protein phosphatase 2C [Candidatus Argoarchaeum ethanivorans]|uniref:Protein phosphatase 2C n=1 Tax=Candidatus Argoarchaeum ethanivorans TaxID=2608793 RepID=A0A811TCJ5_9EURY|nr:MAG: Protein phosphatase 2C [Candidatus Argoarchaeum ethanivorans]
MENACLTDIGLKKENNEDSVAINRVNISSNEDITDFTLLVVADGVGGLESGEVASYQAIKIISDNFATTASDLAYNFKHKLMMGNYIDWRVSNMLTSSIKEANYAIYGKTLGSVFGGGSATTVCAVVIQNNKAYIANVGDSRAYIINKDRIVRKTVDHSIVEELLRQGELTEEEAFKHPHRNVITRAVGSEEEVEVDIYKDILLKKDDYILVCSDGLTDLVREKEIHELVLQNKNLDEVCRKLVDKANEYGGKDNISVVIVKMDHLPEEKKAEPIKIEKEEEEEAATIEPKDKEETEIAEEYSNEPRDEPVKCKNCGHENLIGETFCEKCGYDLSI